MKSTSSNFKKGDKVVIYRKEEGRKLNPTLYSGFTITNLFKPDAYKVQKDDFKARVNKKHTKFDHHSLISDGGVVEFSLHNIIVY